MICEDCKHGQVMTGRAEVIIDGENVGRFDGVTIIRCKSNYEPEIGHYGLQRLELCMHYERKIDHER